MLSSTDHMCFFSVRTLSYVFFPSILLHSSSQEAAEVDLANEQSEAEAIAMSLAAASINTTADNEDVQDEEEQEDDESQDRSLEDLLNSRSGSETRGRIQSEIAAMRSRLLATVAAPTGAPRSGGIRTGGPA